ncbi:MAG: type II secretion system protein [Ignavibacteriales bacterium]|nr:type II secretion system protein [Ignavibacteriales bacterium]
MGILKDQSGYTLIETLVSIGLLGVLIVLSAMVYKNFFSNPKILLRNEALYLANNEIVNSINKKIFTDTAYTNENKNLSIERKITGMGRFNRVEVVVTTVQDPKELVKLSADIKK